MAYRNNQRNLRKAHTFHCTSVFVHGKKLAHIRQYCQYSFKENTQDLQHYNPTILGGED